MVEMAVDEDGGVSYDLSDDTLLVDFDICVEGYVSASTDEEVDALETALADKLGVEDVSVWSIDIEREGTTTHGPDAVHTYVSGQLVVV